jgi:hypothetical protein
MKPTTLTTFALTFAIGMAAYAGSVPPPTQEQLQQQHGIVPSASLPLESPVDVRPELCAARATLLAEFQGKRKEGIAEDTMLHDILEFLKTDPNFDTQVNDSAAVTGAIKWLYKQPIEATNHQVGQKFYDECVERFEAAQNQKEI